MSDSHQTITYLDHGATSWPKPPGVQEALALAVSELGGSPGRGHYGLAMRTTRAVHSVRRGVARFLGVAADRQVLFQPGCTQALNLVLFGLLEEGDRVVATSVEHNAVARPLNVLGARGVEVDVLDTDSQGLLDIDDLEQALKRPAKVVVCQHAGNLSGAIQPIKEAARIAHDAGALLVVDGAQAGGHLEVDCSELGVDAWACSGHKGLLGPTGIAVLYLSKGCQPRELVVGGTGSASSELPTQPTELPERYEAGTPNTPGILGLGAAVDWLVENAVNHRERERLLTRRLHEGLLELGFRVIGPPVDAPRVPIVAATYAGLDAGRMAAALDREFGVAVRSGLHCAPWAHRTFGTLETGALRFGLGYGNDADDVDCALAACASLLGDLT